VSVIETGLDPVDTCAGVVTEYEELALRGVSVCEVFPLAVHLDEMRGLLHQAVDLRGEEVVPGAQTHIEGLAAAPERQIDLARLQVALERNGVGSVEVAQGLQEGLLQVAALSQIIFHLQGNDLGVRGETVIELHPGGLERGLQGQVVVDITVEGHVDAPAAPAIAGIVP